MTTIEAARLLMKIVVAKHLHDLAPITHGLTADLEKLRCLIHDHIPMVNPMTFPLERSFAGGAGVPPRTLTRATFPRHVWRMEP